MYSQFMMHGQKNIKLDDDDEFFVFVKSLKINTSCLRRCVYTITNKMGVLHCKYGIINADAAQSV